MRRFGLIAFAVGMLLPSTGQTGVYFTNPKDAGNLVAGPSVGADGVQALPPDTFNNALGDWRNLWVDQPSSPAREQFLKARNQLQEKVRAGTATVDDRSNLSAYLIRLNQAEEAVALLRELARDREKDNFMVSANLGAAYLMTGNLRAASDSTDQALYHLKRGWPGWSKEKVEWITKMEKEQKKLTRLRLREASKEPGGRSKPPENVDDLFGVNFVGDDGTYQPGRIAEAQKAKLPKDALAEVQQLALWYPADSRLYWLVGEVLNAEGRPRDAWWILDQCAYSRGMNAPKLQEHRQVLLDASQQVPPPPSWLPDTRKLIAVGIGAGLIVALLLYLQFREIHRRRLAKLR